MRPLTIAVLVAPPALGDARTPRDRSAAGLQARVDRRSAADVAATVEQLGHRALVLTADANLDLTLRHSDIDGCILTLHGPQGSQGDIQALLELRGIPTGGPSRTATMLAGDKLLSRQILAHHNLPTPTAVSLGPGKPADERALELLGWPCVLKPRRGALRLGVSHLYSAQQIRPAISEALAVDEELLLERQVQGREVQVVVLDGLVVGMAEVEPDPAPGPQMRTIECPPALPRGRRAGIENLALRAAKSLGLDTGLVRVDLMLTPRDNEVILEVEPRPPLHHQGVVARVAQAAGLSPQAWVRRLLDPVVLNAQARPGQSSPARSAEMWLQ